MQITNFYVRAKHIDFIPVQLELSTFKKDEAAQTPTPPEYLAFLGSPLTSQKLSNAKEHVPYPWI